MSEKGLKRRKSKRDDQLMTIPEAIITVHIHKPQSTFGKLNFRRGHKNLFVHILTQTSLTQLRNAIKCPKDLEIPGDFSMAPDSGRTQASKRLIQLGHILYRKHILRRAAESRVLRLQQTYC
ncbi:hypothetical protein EB796_001659 [Bugula neritina]|uniref:Uncharacterized protein n=1 Tax=Bugula neritina TaxID=10212 RepID=A0A7J7KPN3_BUGNE|nr:hypothetical protein EB796_001659 [Bugula neritina]